MKRFFINFLADETGATAIEYSLIATMISISAIVALQTYGASLGSMLQFVAGTISAGG
ncbi:MAG: Flp family type IVb pilin [Alphaproteobacteria bacterium]|nr:Flp family type IVb pilin [Alphaproteobacteria bacterium]